MKVGGKTSEKEPASSVLKMPPSLSGSTITRPAARKTVMSSSWAFAKASAKTRSAKGSPGRVPVRSQQVLRPPFTENHVATRQSQTASDQTAGRPSPAMTDYWHAKNTSKSWCCSVRREPHVAQGRQPRGWVQQATQDLLHQYRLEGGTNVNKQQDK